MTECDEFLAEIVPVLRAAQEALYSGNVDPWLTLWSDTEPLSWLGQFGTRANGRDGVAAHFRRVADRMSGVEHYQVVPITVDVAGGWAYLAAEENVRVRIDGNAPVAMTARVSRVFRREASAWRLAHGHADLEPSRLNLPWQPPGSNRTELNHEH